MKYWQTHSVEIAAAKASISRAKAYRIEKEASLPSQNRSPHGRRRPDPFEHMFDAVVVPLLKTVPGIRAVAVYDEMLRRKRVLVAVVRKLAVVLHAREPCSAVSRRRCLPDDLIA